MTTFVPTHAAAFNGPKVVQSDGFLSSNYVRNKVTQFTNKANDLANQLLAPKNTTYDGPVVIRNNYYYSYSPFYSPWYYRPSVIVVDRGGRNRRSNDQDNGKSALLGIVLTAGAIFMSYFVGTALSSYQDANREFQNARKSHNEFASYRGYASPDDLPLLDEARVATSLQERICTRIRNSAMLDLALRIGLTVGLVIGAVGAFTAPPILALGFVVGAVSAAAMLAKWGLEVNDKKNVADALALRESIHRLRLL